MADIGSPITYGVSPDTANIVTPTVTTGTVNITADTLRNPNGATGLGSGSADLMGLVEKCKIQLLDYYADL